VSVDHGIDVGRNSRFTKAEGHIYDDEMRYDSVSSGIAREMRIAMRGIYVTFTAYHANIMQHDKYMLANHSRLQTISMAHATIYLPTKPYMPDDVVEVKRNNIQILIHCLPEPILGDRGEIISFHSE